MTIWTILGFGLGIVVGLIIPLLPLSGFGRERMDLTQEREGKWAEKDLESMRYYLQEYSNSEKMIGTLMGLTQKYREGSSFLSEEFVDVMEQYLQTFKDLPEFLLNAGEMIESLFMRDPLLVTQFNSILPELHNISYNYKANVNHFRCRLIEAYHDPLTGDEVKSFLKDRSLLSLVNLSKGDPDGFNK